MKSEIKLGSFCKKTVYILICGMFLFTSWGCGKKTTTEGQNGQSGQTMEEVNSYKATFTTIPAENNDVSSVKIAKDCLYSLEYNYNEKENESSTNLTAKNISDMELLWSANVSEMFEDFAPEILKREAESAYGVNVPCYNIREDGVSLMATAYIYDKDNDSAKYFTAKIELDKDGKLLQGMILDELSNIKDSNGDPVYFSNCIFTQDETIILSTDQEIWIVDSTGKISAKINVGEWIDGIYLLKDSVYVKYWSNGPGGPTLSKLDIAQQKLGEELKNIPSNVNGCCVCPDIEDQILFYNSEGVFLYDLKEQTAKKDLQWINCDIMGDFINSMTWVSDGHYVAISNDWNSNKVELIDLVRLAEGQIDDREIISIALMYPDQMFTEAVVGFNKSQDKYRLNAKSYLDFGNGIDYDTAMLNYQNDLMGDNPPDLIALQSFNFNDYLEKDVFADLKPMIEASDKVHLEDYFENVLDAYVYRDKLVAIPVSLQISTLAVNRSDFSKMGWTVDEMIDYDESHPEANLVSYPSRESMYSMIFSYTMPQFVDWETGECKFDTPQFKKILEYLSGFSSAEEWDNGEREESMPVKIQKKELLVAETYIADVNEVQVTEAMFGGPGKACFIGFPTLDGTPTAAFMIGSGGEVAINEKGNKEGAWAFLEYYLSRDAKENNFGHGLPANKKALQKQIDEELEKAKSGEECGSSMGYDGWEYTYHFATQEEIDTFLAILNSAKARPWQNEEILKIISEETEPLYRKQKTVDEVATVIQSRIRLYVSEHM